MTTYLVDKVSDGQAPHKSDNTHKHCRALSYKEEFQEIRWFVSMMIDDAIDDG